MNKVNQDFDTSLLRILVCPKTHTKLTFDNIKLELISKAAGLAYPIKNGITNACSFKTSISPIINN